MRMLTRFISYPFNAVIKKGLFIAGVLAYFLIPSVQHCSVTISNPEGLLEELIKTGFENVAVKKNSGGTVIYYENRIYRLDIDAIKDVIKIAIPYLQKGDMLTLVPQKRGIPVVYIEVAQEDCSNYCAGKISASEFGRLLKISMEKEELSGFEDQQMENSSYSRFDLVIKPGFSFEFGPYQEPVMWQFNILPELKTSLWKGMDLSYETVLPVHNDFGRRYDSVRTGTAVINQMLRFPGSLFVSASAGIFTQNRYGFDFETRKYFCNGNLSIGLDMGYTDYVSFSGYNKIYYSNKFIFTGNVSADYRFEEYDLTVGVSAGKYLYGDTSLRFDINREFGETEIGFFVLRSTAGVNNGGITVSVPLFPSKWMNPGFIRVVPAESYSTSYIVKSNVNDLIGLRYNTGSRINSFLKKMNPDFIRNNF